MCSTRIYLVPRSHARLYHHPRLALPRSVVTAPIIKWTPHYTIRTCSGWRRNGHVGHRNHQDKPAKNGEAEESSSTSPWRETQYEPSRREKMWQERMNRIRQMIEEDPYEALFGRSNRLLKGLRQDWAFDHPRWRHREISFSVRNPFLGRKVEIETDAQTEVKRAQGSQNATTPVPGVEAEQELEYDPISNRMIKKSLKDSTVQSGRPEFETRGEIRGQGGQQTHDASFNPAGDKTSLSNRSNSELAGQSVKLPIRKPTFTMLKEDIPFKPSDQVDSSSSTSARAEYEAYKAKRLQAVGRANKWLEDEGFGHQDLSSNNQIAPRLQSDMERQFDDLHSKAHTLAEEQLGHRKPWGAQRSKGTSLHAHPRRTAEHMLTYDEAIADNEVQDYTMQVAADNLKNRQAVTGAKPMKENETAGPTKQAFRGSLVHPATDADAAKEIRDYHVKVAGNNIRNRHLDEKLQQRALVEEWKAEARRTEFARFNEETKRLHETRLQEREQQKRLSEVSLTALKNIREIIHDAKGELVQIQPTKAPESTSMVEEQIRDTRQTKVKPSDPATTLETSLQRYGAKIAIAGPSPLKTSIQRLSRASTAVSEASQPPTVQVTEQMRTHDPVGYNHSRESNKVQHVNNVESKEKPRWPSLAEMFGYRKPRHQGRDNATTADTHRSATQLQGEIDAQKAAFHAFESSAKLNSPTILNSKDATKISGRQQNVATKTEQTDSIPQRVAKELEQKKKDAALVREIRSIYEDKYGPITTSHTQLEVSTAPAEASLETKPSNKNVESACAVSSIAEKVQAPTDTQQSEPQLSSKSEPAEEVPASRLSTPTPARTAKYTILAYDSKSKNMTTASFESVPSPTESAIPGTVALRHLTYANRFLAKLIELQHRGYVPVHAERNLLILRQDATRATNEELKSFAPGRDPVQNETIVEGSADESKAKEPKRLEPVFSGRRSHEKAWRKWKEAQRAARHKRRRRFGRAIRLVSGGVVLSGAVIYLAGVGAEVRQNRGRSKVVVTGDRPNNYGGSPSESK